MDSKGQTLSSGRALSTYREGFIFALLFVIPEAGYR